MCKSQEAENVPLHVGWFQHGQQQRSAVLAQGFSLDLTALTNRIRKPAYRTSVY